jgi:hypothetical protein
MKRYGNIAGKSKTPAVAGVCFAEGEMNYMAATKSGTIMGLFS